MFKKVLATCLAGAMAVSLAACGSSSPETQAPATTAAAAQEQESAEASGDTGAAASGDAIIVKVGYENTDAEPIGQAMKHWKELVEEQGDGSIQLELFPNSSLGTKSQLIDMMLLGQPVITIADGAFYADYGAKDMGILYGPFFFDTWDDVWTLIESDWYADGCAKLEEKGLKILASNWIYGERHLMTKNKVETPEDIKGLKVRVASSEIYMEGWNALGATATGIALGETYQALQTGVVEGVENPLSVLYAQSFQEVTPNLLMTSHIKNFTTWVCGSDFFGTLTPEQQELLVSTAEEAGLYNNELQAEADDEYMQKLLDAGVTVTEMTDENLAAWKEKAQAFYEKGDQFGWSDGLYETARAAMGK